MKQKNNPIQGRGLLHPEQSKNGNFAEIIPIPTSNTGGYIYIALSDIGLVKVGKTKNIAARIKQLSSGSGVDITEVAAFGPFVNYGALELIMHDKLTTERRSGEWFATDFDTVKVIAEEVTKEGITGHESAGVADNSAATVYLWLDAHEWQLKYEKELLPILSGDAMFFLNKIGSTCAAYVAEKLYNVGMIILHDGVTGYSVYPGGFEKASLSELKNNWIAFRDNYPEDYDADDNSEFTDYLIEISDKEKFSKEAETWRNDRVMRLYTESVENYQRWLARHMEAISHD